MSENHIKGLIGYIVMFMFFTVILIRIQTQTITSSVVVDTLSCHKKEQLVVLPSLITAYSNDPGSINVPKWRDGLTASLTKAEVGTIAADTRFYKFGTDVYIPGYGFGKIQDRGGKIKGRNRFDVFMDTRDQALEWGVVKAPVLIMMPVDDHVYSDNSDYDQEDNGSSNSSCKS